MEEDDSFKERVGKKGFHPTAVKMEEESSDERESDDVDSLSVGIESVGSEFCSSDGRAYKRGPYKSYSKQEKRHAVDLYRSNHCSITEVSRNLGIPCKNIKRWATEGVDRKRGGGRKKTNPHLESEVYKWIYGHHKFGDRIEL